MMDRIQKAVWERIHSSPNELFKALFLWAYRHKRRRFRRGLDTPVLNWLFFSKVKRVLGGEVHTILSGGAPLSQDSLEFITVCMCCYVGQGSSPAPGPSPPRSLPFQFPSSSRNSSRARSCYRGVEVGPECSAVSCDAIIQYILEIRTLILLN